MDTRRIVTGHSATGKSVFVSDTTTPRNHKFKHVPGFETSLVWSTEPGGVVPASGDDPTEQAFSWVPQTDGTRLMVVTFPPDSVMGSLEFDPVAAGGEYTRTIPGLAERFEIESPGMHTTDTVDYAVLLDGELYLELDDGQRKKLARHDIVVQQGTRHAWRNLSNAPATILFVLVGAERRR